MSGGYFNYNQYNIDDIADQIERVLNKFGTEYYEYSNETKLKFKETIRLLRKAGAAAHRIDWLLSGDDGEETFHERWKDEVECK